MALLRCTGTLLPKEAVLSNQLGVSRSTIRQATNKLELEGLLTRKKRVGSKAANNNPLSTSLDHWYSFTQEMKERGVEVFNLALDARWVPAEQALATFFKIKNGSKVLKLSKLKGTKGHPVAYFESYFHPSIGVCELDDFEMPLYTLLERKYGVVLVKSCENISAQVASKHAGKLKISAADPVLVRERLVFDSGDNPVEYNVGYYRSDKVV